MGTGELAAAATACCWAATSICVTQAGRRIGSPAVNRIRLAIAIPLLLAACALTGTWGPTPTPQVVLLVASGVVGLAIGDGAYFEALVRLGPRRASLLMTCAPLFAALVARVGLGNPLGPIAPVGMALTLAGVAWVVSERTTGAAPPATLAGVTLGLVGAAGQGVGIVLAKAGLGLAPPDSPLGRLVGDQLPIDPLQGTAIRMVAAALLLFALAARRRELGGLWTATRDRRAMAWTTAGAVAGPFVGVWLSLIAVARTHAAVAATIMAISPVLIIPAAAVVDRERVSLRAVAGAALAVAGVAVLAFRDQLGG